MLNRRIKDVYFIFVSNLCKIIGKCLNIDNLEEYFFIFVIKSVFQRMNCKGFIVTEGIKKIHEE